MKWISFITLLTAFLFVFEKPLEAQQTKPEMDLILVEDIFNQLSDQDRVLIHETLSQINLYNNVPDGNWTAATAVALYRYWSLAAQTKGIEIGDLTTSASITVFLNSFSADTEQILLGLNQNNNNEEANTVSEKKIATPDDIITTLIAKCDGMYSLKGVCWAMTGEEMAIVLSSKGYPPLGPVCDGNGCIYVNRITGASVFASYTGGKKTHYMRFACDTFDVCTYTINEIADLLVQHLTEKGAVRPLSSNSQDSRNYFIKKSDDTFCSTDMKGQELCVVREKNIGQLSLVLRYADYRPSTKPKFN